MLDLLVLLMAAYAFFECGRAYEAARGVEQFAEWAATLWEEVRNGERG